MYGKGNVSGEGSPPPAGASCCLQHLLCQRRSSGSVVLEVFSDLRDSVSGNGGGELMAGLGEDLQDHQL